jgi:hypothetical protein
MTPETAIYLYGAACGAIGLLIAQAVIRALSRWLSREEHEFTGGEL